MMDRHSNAASDKVKLLCHACGARYLIPVSKIRGRRFRARCKRCSEEIVARYRGGEFEVLSGRGAAAETPAPVDADAIWYVAVGGEPLGPITAREVEGYVYRGEVNADTYTWCESLPEWQPLAEIRELRHLVLEQARGIDHSAEEPPTGFFERDEAPPAVHSESDPSVPTRVAEPHQHDAALADTAYLAGEEGYEPSPPSAAARARLTGGLPDSFSEPETVAASADEDPYTRPIGRAPKDWDAAPVKSAREPWHDKGEDWPPADAPPAGDLFDSFEKPWAEDQEPGQLEAMDEFEDEATRLVRQRVDDIPDRRELTGQVRRPEDWSQNVDAGRWGNRPGKVESSQIQSISGIELKKRVEVSEVRLWAGARGPVTLPPPSMTMGDSPLRHLTSKGLPPPPSPPPPPIPAAAAPPPPAASDAPLVPPPAPAGAPPPAPAGAPPPPFGAPAADPLLPSSAMAGSFDAQIPSLAAPGRAEPEEQVSDILPSLVPQLPAAAPVAPPVVPSNLLTPQRPFWTPLTIVLFFVLGLSLVAGATVAVVLVLRRPAAPEVEVAVAPGGVTEKKAAIETKTTAEAKKPSSEKKAAEPSTTKEAAPAPKEAAPAPKVKAAPKKRVATKRRTWRKKKTKRSRRRRKQKSVDALVDSAAGDVLAAGRKTTKRKKSSGSAAEDVLAAGSASAAPTRRRKLDRASIKRSMAQLKPRVRGCFDRFKQGGVLRLRFTIRGNGTARGRAVGSFAGTPTAACVEGGISSMRFPRFSGPATTVTYPFRLQ